MVYNCAVTFEGCSYPDGRPFCIFLAQNTGASPFAGNLFFTRFYYNCVSRTKGSCAGSLAFGWFLIWGRSQYYCCRKKVNDFRIRWNFIWIAPCLRLFPPNWRIPLVPGSEWWSPKFETMRQILKHSAKYKGILRDLFWEFVWKKPSGAIRNWIFPWKRFLMPSTEAELTCESVLTQNRPGITKAEAGPLFNADQRISFFGSWSWTFGDFLNPDELLNNDVKSNALSRQRLADREEMVAGVRGYLRSTQKNPEVVMRYFQHPSVAYAAWSVCYFMTG